MVNGTSSHLLSKLRAGNFQYKTCRKPTSIRKGSFWSNFTKIEGSFWSKSKLPLTVLSNILVLLGLLYFFCEDLNVSQTQKTIHSMNGRPISLTFNVCCLSWTATSTHSKTFENCIVIHTFDTVQCFSVQLLSNETSDLCNCILCQTFRLIYMC